MKKTLILLIGTNPLPNYLVASYFLSLKEGSVYVFDEIIPVYSTELGGQKETKPYWDALKIILEKDRPEIKITDVALNNVSNKSLIEKDLQKSLLTSGLDKKEIHLNYTGGTKTMAVHVYNYFYSNYNEVEFSYLDIRNDILHQHSKDEDTNSDLITAFTKNIIISLSDLKDMHLLKFYDTKAKKLIDAQHINTFDQYDSFSQLIQNNYPAWKDLMAIKNNTKKNGDAKRRNTFNRMINEHSWRNACRDNQFGVFIDSTDLPYNFLNMSSIPIDQFPQYESTIDYIFNDKYFEHLCYIALKAAILEYNISNPNLQIGEFGTSSTFIKCITGRITGKDFEIDLYFIKGTHFFGISCTTSIKRNMLKSKGFEIIHRSKQIGGEEATAIVIYPEYTPYKEEDKPEYIEEELQQDSGATNKRFLMRPYRDIKTLKEDFTHIINAN